jgi:hypothetical protein
MAIQIKFREFLSRTFAFKFFDRNSLFRKISDNSQPIHIISKMYFIYLFIALLPTPLKAGVQVFLFKI